MKINFQYPYFKDMIQYGLHRDKRAHACWYYAVLAQKNHANVGDGPESQMLVVNAAYDDVNWLNKEYRRIADSVAMMYGLAGPNDFMNYSQNVIEVGLSLEIPIIFHPEIWKSPTLFDPNT